MQCKKLEDRAEIEVDVSVKEDYSGADGGNDMRDKKNWMSSVQLWNTGDVNSDSKQHDSKSETKQVNRSYCFYFCQKGRICDFLMILRDGFSFFGR